MRSIGFAKRVGLLLALASGKTRILNSNEILIRRYIKYIKKLEQSNDLFKPLDIKVAKEELRNLLIKEDSKSYL